MAEVKVPELAESITEGTISEWLKNPGDSVEKGDYLLELETDKVNVEIIAEHSGILESIGKAAGEIVQVGETIAVISEGKPGEQTHKEEVKAVPSPPKQEETVKQGDMRNQESVLATPAARKLAREKGINLNQVEAVDLMGRVNKQDVEKTSKQPAEQPVLVSKQPSQSVHDKPADVIKMSRRRQTIARRLVEVQRTAAILTTFNEIDMSAVMNLRKKRKDQFQQIHEVKLGFMSFFTKAVIGALKTYPLLNAEVQGDELLIKKYYDIGIAVSAPEGLVVPVVRNADRLNFAEIEREIANLAMKARQAKLGLADLQGGTFTITNGGTFGSLLSTPILNAPQVGILGMHSIQYRPVAVNNELIEIRPMMYIALSYDHRIVDGREAVGFLVKVKELLEDPEKLLLEG
ncbi:dihydrolipoyllysine-residue succinyltransferase [Pradoshia eiseniae]|uniref:Dihydrolipoyllysine-residue succinyltransferase component of 2-oxoglutarate dehydrogenase complex n=1 Tax=Pradoshia eiseniae TaxID=2064768 RepID=A0A2S7MZQ9_9BACI|nr:2-oxoglutarate dehydrogenase complex dihydrolipoyllysine-residue succinyltransferase [Pradoshia eiseniae]PQD95259.1 dihydrolipoyllysine-residue succinyltransferase [Pradoshia eiseniae]